MKPSVESKLPVLWVPPASVPSVAAAATAAPADEAVRYAVRPGLAALPEGGLAMIGFALLQLFPLLVILWAVWWPGPATPAAHVFAVGTTIFIGLVQLFVFGLILRPRRTMLPQLALMPFMRLTVTDRRVLWTLPWRRDPLFEIAAARIRGGLLGPSDGKGGGAAAIMLVPGDPAGDANDLIHFDRLPDAAGFVEALRRLV